MNNQYSFFLGNNNSSSILDFKSPQISPTVAAIKRFSSENQTNPFLDNYTTVLERVERISDLSIESCDSNKLEQFLLSENAKENLRKESQEIPIKGTVEHLELLYRSYILLRFEKSNKEFIVTLIFVILRR